MVHRGRSLARARSQAPPVTPGDDARFPNQGYLDPAPEGIDAEYAWTVTGGDGAGQNFVDIEWGWTLNHEDLVAHGISLLSGINNGYEGHGTAVLGEVAAVDNMLGCVGITPALASVNVIGQWRTAADYDIADAILDACGRMGFGDVLLLEAHNDYNGFTLVPVEAYDDTYEMIRLATALGIIVVEAGGNGGEDLDLVTNPGGDNFFDPTTRPSAIPAPSSSARRPPRPPTPGWASAATVRGSIAMAGALASTRAATVDGHVDHRLYRLVRRYVERLAHHRRGRPGRAGGGRSRGGPAAVAGADARGADRTRPRRPRPTIRRWTASGSCRTCGRSSRTGSSTCVPMSISATLWATPETRMPARSRPVRT